MEYYIYNTPVFLMDAVPGDVDIPLFCLQVEELIGPTLLDNVDVVYIGEFKELSGRNAAYMNGAIYMKSQEPTTFDMLENFLHEVAHSLESKYSWQIYDDQLVSEFKHKRQQLKRILDKQGYKINPLLYDYAEYNARFDEFLSNDVGYPALLNLTMGLFVSPYGATSIQEYFANGLEKYFLESTEMVRKISPVLYQKIDDIVNETT